MAEKGTETRRRLPIVPGMIVPPSTLIGATLTDACGADPGFLCELVFDNTDSEMLAELSDLLVRPAKVLLIFLAAWIVSRIARRLIGRGIRRVIDRHLDETVEPVTVPEEEEEEAGRLELLVELTQRRAEKTAIQAERSRRRTETLGTVLKSAASLVIYTVATLMALSEFDVNLGPLIAGAGIVGIAFGFGAQSMVKDFLSGIFMLLEDQFGVGDIVDVGAASGLVEKVSLRSTRIRDVNGTLWHVPNGEIVRVANKSQQWARAVLDIEVAYDTDIKHAMSVIKQVADGVWREALPNATIIEEPEVWGVENFGASAIVLRLAIKVEPGEQFATSRIIRQRLKEAFDREGIEIPFPQQTVWMHQMQPDNDRPARTTATEVEVLPQSAPEGESD